MKEKILFFMKKNLKHTENNTLYNLYFVEFFLTITSYQFIKID